MHYRAVQFDALGPLLTKKSPLVIPSSIVPPHLVGVPYASPNAFSRDMHGEGPLPRAGIAFPAWAVILAVAVPQSSVVCERTKVKKTLPLYSHMLMQRVIYLFLLVGCTHLKKCPISIGFWLSPAMN